MEPEILVCLFSLLLRPPFLCLGGCALAERTGSSACRAVMDLTARFPKEDDCPVYPSPFSNHQPSPAQQLGCSKPLIHRVKSENTLAPRAVYTCCAAPLARLPCPHSANWAEAYRHIYHVSRNVRHREQKQGDVVLFLKSQIGCWKS